jgi:hypothetical protein
VIGGTSTGVAGQTVTVTLNGVSYTGPVKADGSWSVTIPKAALTSAALADGSYLVTANVSDQNGIAASQASLTLDVHETLPTLAINPIDSNDVLNAAEAQQPLAIAGTSTEAVGGTVTVALNGVAYTNQVASDGTLVCDAAGDGACHHPAARRDLQGHGRCHRPIRQCRN